MKGASLLTFGEKRRKTEVSTPLLFISVVEAAFVSPLVCGTTDIEETFNPTWILTEFCIRNRSYFADVHRRTLYQRFRILYGYAFTYIVSKFNIIVNEISII